MPPNDHPPQKKPGPGEHGSGGSTDAASSPEVGRVDPATTETDDRGGSRDGERLDTGEAGDRGQLDHDGGQKPMK